MGNLGWSEKLDLLRGRRREREVQPVIVRGGGERGNLSWTRDQHPI